MLCIGNLAYHDLFGPSHVHRSIPEAPIYQGLLNVQKHVARAAAHWVAGCKTQPINTNAGIIPTSEGLDVCIGFTIHLLVHTLHCQGPSQLPKCKNSVVRKAHVTMALIFQWESVKFSSN